MLLSLRSLYESGNRTAASAHVTQGASQSATASARIGVVAHGVAAGATQTAFVSAKVAANASNAVVSATSASALRARVMANAAIANGALAQSASAAARVDLRSALTLVGAGVASTLGVVVRASGAASHDDAVMSALVLGRMRPIEFAAMSGRAARGVLRGLAPAFEIMVRAPGGSKIGRAHV